jgi:hypothetical protein
MKEKIKKFKEIWAVTRYRGLIKLGIGIAFMVLVYILIGGFNQMVPLSQLPGLENNENKKSITNDILENYINMDSCEYTYSVEVNNGNATNKFQIDGTYFNKNYYFKINNQDYTIKDNEIYLVDSENKKLVSVSGKTNNIFNIIDLRLLSINNIHTFLTSSSTDDGTKYKDGTENKKYSYTSYDNKSISFVVNGKNNVINTIDIDFKNYVKGYTLYNVNITYKNINNIVEYAKDYTNYQIVKEGA